MILSYKKRGGFTIIELMIVLVILGVLAAVAVPAYQDYVVRSKIAEGMNLINVAKTAVVEYYTTSGIMPNNNLDAGLPEKISGNNVAYVKINQDGIIAAKMNDSVADGGIITLVPKAIDGVVKWKCTPGDGMDKKFLPSSCR